MPEDDSLFEELDTSESSFEEQFGRKYREQAEKNGRFNLAIFGKTGVGKSTLINAIFGDDVAPVGVGEPVTMEEHLYLHQDGALGILDTRGLEIGVDSDEILRELEVYIERMRHQPLSDQIHVAWYCVRSGDNRFEETEGDFIERLHELGLPVVVVLTQVRSRHGEHHPDAIRLASNISDRKLPIVGERPVLVMASGDEFSDQVAHGLQELLDATFLAAPDGVASALAAAQKIDLDRKWNLAHTAIVAAGVAAAAVGAAPIPVADAAVLVPIQLGLMATISAVYGVKADVASVAATVATAVAVNAGKSVVVGLIKLIPGAGTIVGGVISAATASAFTLAMGYAWAAVCSQLVQGNLRAFNGALDSEAVRALFKSEYLEWFKKLLPGGA